MLQGQWPMYRPSLGAAPAQRGKQGLELRHCAVLGAILLLRTVLHTVVLYLLHAVPIVRSIT